MTPPLDPVQLTEIRERTLREAAKLPRQIGRYQIRGELGTGGMGIVYDGWDEQLHRAVALKIIHRDKLGETAGRADIAARFEKEMRATSDIFHPNIVAILDAGIEDTDEGPRAYFVMERIEGDSLEERLRRSGRLPRSEALRLGAALARGLAAAHAKGLVHRDLKPSNVLLAADGEPRIADFGLCRFRGEMGSLTDAGTILGSANYISPEQLRGEDVTGAADLFSLGAILLRSITGEEPFPADSIAAHFQRILADEPDGLDTLDPELRALVAQLVAKDPAHRPASAVWVAERLTVLASATTGGGSPPVSLGAGLRSGDRKEDPTVRGGGPPASPPPAAVASRGSNRMRGLAIALAVLVVFGAIAARNQLVSLDAAAQTQWKQVENQLARQGELIPKLVEVTSKYAAYETQTIGTVISARERYAGAGRADRQEAAAEVSEALDGLLLVAERYPNLKADAHYRALAYEIAGSKNRIAVERMRYNEAVGALNARLGQLPWSLLAGSLDARAYFDPSQAQMADPALDL